MYVVYILKSVNKHKYYIGYTNNLDRRLQEHQSGHSAFDRAYKPFKLVYTQIFQYKSQAHQRELQIKSYKGGNAFKQLLVG